MLDNIKYMLKKCPCGNTHTLFTDTIKIEKNASQKAIEYIKEKFKTGIGLIICDENTKSIADKCLNKQLQISCCTLAGGIHANEIAIENTEKFIFQMKKKPTYLIACGSGSIHDITRFIAHKTEIPFISFPTAASVDGFVSNVAAMTINGQKITYQAVSPIALFADINIFSKAPKELTASGVGDIFGKYTAIFDWKVANLLSGEPICNEIINLEYEAIHKLEDKLEYITEEKLASAEYIQLVMECLVLSGIAIQLATTSRPASGAEHHLAHLWEMKCINDETPAFHGEKVGVATLLVLHRYKRAINDGSLNKRYVFDSEKLFDKSNLESIFGSLTDGIISENMPNGDVDNCSLNKVRIIKYERGAGQIKAMINELPSPKLIFDYLMKSGAKISTTSLGLPGDDEFIKTSLKYAPYVRNRLSLLKIIEM